MIANLCMFHKSLYFICQHLLSGRNCNTTLRPRLVSSSDNIKIEFPIRNLPMVMNIIQLQRLIKSILPLQTISNFHWFPHPNISIYNIMILAKFSCGSQPQAAHNFIVILWLLQLHFTASAIISVYHSSCIFS